jgi:hypothetical protein
VAPPEPSLTKFPGYDLTKAIEARRIMRYEVHSRDHVLRDVYNQSDNALRNLAVAKPATLTAIASDYWAPNPENWQGKYRDVDIALPSGSLLYIGCVLDRKLTEEIRKFRLDDQRLILRHQDILQEDLLKIRREGWLCTIPSMSDELPTNILTDAVRRYFVEIAPGLEATELQWLNDSNPHLANLIEQKLDTEARRLADPRHNVQRLTRQQIAHRLLTFQDRL